LVYGINSRYTPIYLKRFPLSRDEKAKINLITGTLFHYKLKTGNLIFEDFIGYIFKFYKDLGLEQDFHFEQISKQEKKKHLPNLKTFLFKNIFRG